MPRAEMIGGMFTFLSKPTSSRPDAIDSLSVFFFAG
jgi:hypothetical protein